MRHEPSQEIDGYLRLPQILRIIPVSRSSWWAGIRAGRFPQPVKLGPHTTAWRAGDVRALIARIDRGAE